MLMHFAIPLLAAGLTYAQSLCPRPAPGAILKAPPELRSSNGSLRVDFALRTSVDVYGVRNYCYIYGDSIQSPALRVRPGDEVVLNLKNELPAAGSDNEGKHQHDFVTTQGNPCASSAMTASSTNLHFHGLNLPPVCRQDEVLRTVVQPGDAPFEYRFKIPPNEPPGLYWYHPHPHGFSERQVLGGASGALIVEGIESAAPVVAGLPERILVLRDQSMPGEERELSTDRDDPHASLDMSLNYVPIRHPHNRPAVMVVPPGKREFWRVLNAAADSFFVLRLLYWPNQDTQVGQTMHVIAIDGVPVGSDFASIARPTILLPPGSRAEFVVTTPAAGVFGQLLTERYDNGPFGDVNTYRVLANIRSAPDAPAAPGAMPNVPSSLEGRPFVGLTSLQPVRERLLYFSEKFGDPAHPKRSASYYLTAGDAKPKVFDMNSPGTDLTAVQGTVEDWTIENRAEEAHVFHIHQLHFQLLERDGKRVTESALRDTIDVPYWDGKSSTYPRVKLRMDFRNPNIIGTFLYHCHILEHEDGGMMGSIALIAPQVQQPASPGNHARKK